MADLALPRVCPVCGRPLLLEEDTICLHCLADLPLTHFWEYSHNPMADAFNARIEQIPDLLAPVAGYCYAAALLFYRDGSGYRAVPRALKYGRNFREGRYFAHLLGEKLKSSPYFTDVDFIVPVPLHWTRMWRRGYNQAGLIADEVARSLPGARTVPDILIRRKRTVSQTGLEGEGKSANVSGVFSCTRHAGGLSPKHILIVDDVFTSGSTSSECFRALHKQYGGGTRISVATLSFAGK